MGSASSSAVAPVDLEKGDVTVEAPEPLHAAEVCDPCVLGVVFGAMALVPVVIFLVLYGPWPAVTMAVMFTVLIGTVIAALSRERAALSREPAALANGPSMPQPPGNRM